MDVQLLINNVVCALFKYAGENTYHEIRVSCYYIDTLKVQAQLSSGTKRPVVLSESSSSSIH